MYSGCKLNRLYSLSTRKKGRFDASPTSWAITGIRFEAIRELTNAINPYLAQRNLEPKPYRWCAKGKEILAKIQRARLALYKAKSVK